MGMRILLRQEGCRIAIYQAELVVRHTMEEKYQSGIA